MYIIVWQYYETENLNKNGANGGTLLFVSTKSIMFYSRHFAKYRLCHTILNKDFW
jgi:hypothetical protein